MASETGDKIKHAQTNEVLVRFKNVQKTFDGETLVIKDLNLEILKGEFLTLLGPSGSGKTTTLLMLAGFEAPTHGDIILANRSIKGVPPYKRQIGMVFQNYALFPHMTVAENVAFPLKVRKIEKTEVMRRVKSALEMVQLGGFEFRRPNQLSGGQQQRVALARSLVFEPELVLMDEPLGALDKQLREQMQLEIKHLHEALGVTVVYVTHDQSEALTMSNRIAVFKDGVIQQLATPTDLYEEPANSFVAQFIGENNRLNVVVVNIKSNNICRVKLDSGETVRARAVNIDGVGSKTSLSIRPERVILNPDGDDTSRFTATVKELIYLGDYTRARLQVAGNEEFTIKVSNSRKSVRLRVNQQVTIGWDPEDCRALDPI
ncbi:MAG: ABC transporter ATP-binding protein [Deltaproteobacteria bacterium]|nr:ABC transporter ATP-binding protein [Deltaproteobacteria bacterium]MBW1962347.1 ABC transporter ATP-binding protein [Deltaproteobacteria bacterium]MBW2153479.1 ABC transporter ATP-binding protein [Deltaproteobacteria bacterium]